MNLEKSIPSILFRNYFDCVDSDDAFGYKLNNNDGKRYIYPIESAQVKRQDKTR